MDETANSTLRHMVYMDASTPVSDKEKQEKHRSVTKRARVKSQRRSGKTQSTEVQPYANIPLLDGAPLQELQNRTLPAYVCSLVVT